MEVKCLDKGFVRLIDVMGDDSSIVQAARVSYGDGTKSVKRDRGLIRYLMSNDHTSPFEMVEFKFHCKMPIFVARQWIRHRTANINEVSGRYSKMPSDIYIPDVDDIAKQSTNNKQGRGTPCENASEILGTLDESFKKSQASYNELLESNVAREISRICLPLAQYTEWYWKIDLHNLLHFLKLRLHPHAQKEIRVYADAVSQFVKDKVPASWEAFEDFQLNAIKFSKIEAEFLKKLLAAGKISAIAKAELYDEMKRNLPESLWKDELARLRPFLES